MSYRKFGTIGFALSAAADFLVLSVYLALYALAPYPVSIALRGIGWRRLGEERGVGLYKITGLIVIALGALVFLIIAGVLRGILPPMGTIGFVPAIFYYVAIPLWAVYSLFEFVSYARLKKEVRTFTVACVSIVGILLMLALAAGLRLGRYHFWS